jgi:hypothetical protein
MASRLLTDAPGGEFPVIPVHEAPPRRAGAGGMALPVRTAVQPFPGPALWRPPDRR